MNMIQFFTRIYLLLFTTIALCQSPDLVLNLNMSRQDKWPKSGLETVIDVCWENPGQYSMERALVREAVNNTWGQVANIRFKGWGECPSVSRGIRISISDEHPYCSGLGTQLAGKESGMVLNFTFKEWQGIGDTPRLQAIQFIGVHEFGHALGITHEQRRSDCNCDKQASNDLDGGWFVTTCDPNSVMNYCNEKWNNYGQLSDFDKRGIRSIYGERSNYSEAGVLTFRDQLGEDDALENVYINLGGADITLNVNSESPIDARQAKFTQSGSCTYKVYSKTRDRQGRIISGYGQGTLTLDVSRNYKVDLVGELKNGQYKITLNAQ